MCLLPLQEYHIKKLNPSHFKYQESEKGNFVAHARHVRRRQRGAASHKTE